MVKRARNNWVPSIVKFLGHGCVIHTGTKELLLASKRGEIWIYDDSRCSALIRSPKIASRVGNLVKSTSLNDLKKGEEAVVKFDNSLLPQMIKLLGIKNNRLSMVEYASAQY